jgi:membrane fusion protein
VLVAAVVMFLTTATYSRKETVRGILKPVGGETRVMAPQGGVLRALYVAEGVPGMPGTPGRKRPLEVWSPTRTLRTNPRY